MSSILERAIVHLLNEEEDKAKALFHKFMVEKARAIHESLRTGEDVDLGEGWDDELTSAEYFTAGDLDGVEDGHDDAEADAAADVDGAADTLSDDLHGDVDGDDSMGKTPDADDSDDDSADDADGDDVHDAIQKLVDEFEDMMTKLDGIESKVGGDEPSDDADADDADDTDADADVDSDADADADDDAMDDASKKPGTDAAIDESDDDDEDLEDITESVMAELEKITVNLVDGKEVGAGTTVNQNRKSTLPSSPADKRDGAKPIEQKFDGNDSFDRQSSPSVRDNKIGRNTAKKADDFRSPVAKGGDSSASLNKDFAGGVTPSKSAIDGK